MYKYLNSRIHEVNKPGDRLTHKHNPKIEIELIEPTNKGWKVYQIENGKKKIAYFDKQDISGKKSLFESTLDEPLIISQLRDVLVNGYTKIKDPKTGKRMTVDTYSASAIVKVYDALNPDNKEKFVNTGLLGMQKIAFKLL